MKLLERRVKVKMPRRALEKGHVWTPGRGSQLTPIPPVSDHNVEEIEIYPIRAPFSYARVLLYKEDSEYVYEMWEPRLNQREKELLDRIKDSLVRTLSYSFHVRSIQEKEQFLKEAVTSFVTSRDIDLESRSNEKIIYYIVRDFVGFDICDGLISDPAVEDVSCDGVKVPLFLFHEKYESIKTNVVFLDDETLNSFVVRLGQRCGKTISVSSPILDGTTVEGHRVQATYAREVTTRGSSFTIRRFKEKPFTPVELIAFNTASTEMIAYLWLAVEHGKSMMVCGGTAAGKTATLNSSALFIRPGAKIVSIEDTREINLPHENWIPGTTRSGSGERQADGKAPGEIDMYDLVRAALRQRPNYILVGEVRGKETYTMF
ncbi:MAG: type II/IV secretion system ATPase subunit, partial [Candidatus Thermoplasmatota archaeon]|nr:type II/IV secretion system ATPase subunit [Candidatus Thermoplasmatota archaeon]